MTTLVLDGRNIELRGQGEAAAVYEDGQRKGSVPLAMVERLIVHGGGVTLEAGVLGRLAENGGIGILLSGRHSRRLAYVLGPGHNDVLTRIAQARVVGEPVFVERWSTALVRAKVKHQHRWLGRALDARPDRRKPLSDARERLERALQRLDGIESGAEAAPGVPALRGIEGAAAAAYFQGYAALFAPALQFSGRNRRPPTDPVNAALSLGYTLLHADAVLATQRAGLDPLIGLYHRPAHGRASLASDLIEPLRAGIDEWVWALFRDRVLREEHFWRDGRACLMGKTSRARFYAGYEAMARLPRRWLRMRARRLGDALRTLGAAWLPVADDDETDDL